MRIVALAWVCAPALAWANAEPIVLVAPPAASLARVAQGPTGECAAYSLNPASDSNGTTVLSAHISPGGGRGEPRIVRSSGNVALDRAASACVQSIGFAPMTKDGVPIDVDWQVEIDWPQGQIRAADRNDSCARYYPMAARHAGREGDTLVSFVIAEDGGVSNIRVVESSGDRGLDAATIACVSEFRFHPATHDGKPVAIDGHFIANWRAK